MVAGVLKRDIKDIVPECNQAIAPICSYENPHLVRGGHILFMLLFLSPYVIPLLVPMLSLA